MNHDVWSGLVYLAAYSGGGGALPSETMACVLTDQLFPEYLQKSKSRITTKILTSLLPNS